MKVLLTADVLGGVLTWATELITALQGSGVEVELVTFGGRATRSQRALVDEAGPLAWHESELGLEWVTDAWNDLDRAVDWLRELERDSRPDVVHLSSFGLASAGFRAPAVITAHSDVWSWWRAVHGEDPPGSWKRYREWVIAGLARAAAVIGPTAAVLSDLRRAYGEPAGRPLVIANAVRSADGATVAPHPREPFALAAGRLWDAAKNATTIAAAAARLPIGAVRIAGDPRGSGDLEPAVLLGELSRSELAAERHRAAVFVSPARYEPFGLAVLEAALDGCALVLGDIPSLRELWNGVARFIDPEDPQALADAIGDLLDRPAEAERLGSEARARARSLGGPGVFARAHRALYAELTRVPEAQLR